MNSILCDNASHVNPIRFQSSEWPPCTEAQSAVTNNYQLEIGGETTWVNKIKLTRSSQPDRNGNRKSIIDNN